MKHAWHLLIPLILLAAAASPARSEEPAKDLAERRATWEKNLSARARVGKILDLHFTQAQFATLTGYSLSALILYIDGIPVPGSSPLGNFTDTNYPDVHVLRFDLTNTGHADPAEIDADAITDRGNAKAWRLILSDERKNRPIHVAVGTADATKERIMPLEAKRIRLQSFYGPWPWFAAAIAFLMLGTLIIYGKFSNLLRDATARREIEFLHSPPGFFKCLPGLGSPRVTGLPRPPFSLARVQMAIWLAIIVTAYLFIWLVQDDKNNFNATALTLLGISLATGLIARSIDVGKGSDAASLQDQRAILKAAIDKLEALPAEPAPTPAQIEELAKSKLRLDEIERKLAQSVTPAKEHISEGFLTDILSDENGISLQRLQMLGWTLILALIFVADVWNKLAMPTFDATLLGLMGISAGTYIGFKLPEKKAAPDTTPVP